MTEAKQTFSYGDRTVTLETGEVARQTTGAVICTMGDTVVLAAVVAKGEALEGRDFLPLTVNYQERSYAAGRIPGGFFKREGRPSEKETLISRLIDRPIRPLFPDGFTNEVQVIITVLSLDPEIDPDIPALIGASAALSLSGLPSRGPLGAARVGYRDGDYLLNPPLSELEASELNLVVAGTRDAVLMVESEARELSEKVMLGAVMFGHMHMQVVIDAINTLALAAGKPAWPWQPAPADMNLSETVVGLISPALTEAYGITDKVIRQQRLAAIRENVVASLCRGMTPGWSREAVLGVVHLLERQMVRRRVLAGKQRIDGRDTRMVRPIRVKTGYLPRVHGSSLFTRGETQAMVSATLGSLRDAQIIDALEGERREHFMFHYNFPPYCVGETGFVGTPKRREIGHGRLAKRGIQAVMPSIEEFPYSIRVVSEITESNGSSSMASVCGSSLALMDAGVPIKAPVAGVATGLVKDGDDYVVLTDILGDEDHLGDMDFKVAGTRNGVTALQMDIKIEGITRDIMQQALSQANQARMHILDIMNDHLSTPRAELSAHAPRNTSLKIDRDKIRDLIGKGGATIRGLIEETGVQIDVDDGGTVRLTSSNGAAAEEARRRIEAITADIEAGKTYTGTVAKLMDFGAFVTVLPGKDGLVHVSEIAHERVERAEDYLSVGQQVDVQVLEVDDRGRVRLSIKALKDVSPE